MSKDFWKAFLLSQLKLLITAILQALNGAGSADPAAPTARGKVFGPGGILGGGGGQPADPNAPPKERPFIKLLGQLIQQYGPQLVQFLISSGIFKLPGVTPGAAAPVDLAKLPDDTEVEVSDLDALEDTLQAMHHLHGTITMSRLTS